MMYKEWNWDFTWQQLDPEETFQIQHKLPFHCGPLSPCCTQAGEPSCAVSGCVPWVAFLHGGAWPTSGLKGLCGDEQQSLRFL